MNSIVIKTTITTPGGVLLHETTQTVRIDLSTGLPPVPGAEPSWSVISTTPPTPVKRGPGRPRKTPLADTVTPEPPVKRKPGRPRKNPLPPAD